jgi:hypothetical protein
MIISSVYYVNLTLKNYLLGQNHFLKNLIHFDKNFDLTPEIYKKQFGIKKYRII